ncbi:MAG: 3-isopropylmalate dehydratase small subunit [Firmicutes bacterium]|nr:3-isopropylmalate dehydratase small subunit [Bacillota bacterium]
MKVQGYVHTFGDNVDTDVIYPGQYLNIPNPKDMAAHAMEGIAPDFVKNVKKGDIMVVGQNFGCGSSREHAPLALKEAGIDCVIAKTFARIFYRNAINIGLAILECEEAVDGISAGDSVSIDFDTGVITNVTKGETYQSEPFPEFIKEIISKNGLMNSLK